MELPSGLPGDALKQRELIDGPHLGFRFGVYFFSGGAIPNPLDTRFKRVSGLSADVGVREIDEGGQNLFKHRLPERISYGNLVLERGMVVGSPLHLDIHAAMSLFEFNASNVLVTLFGEDRSPIAGWMFIKAYVTKWSTSDLDAEDHSVLIDTLELAYTRMQPLRI